MLEKLKEGSFVDDASSKWPKMPAFLGWLVSGFVFTRLG